MHMGLLLQDLKYALRLHAAEKGLRELVPTVARLRAKQPRKVLPKKSRSGDSRERAPRRGKPAPTGPQRWQG